MFLFISSKISIFQGRLITIFLLVRGGSDYYGKDTKTIYR
ncbi:hypothetical protein G436_4806 [Leptospira interrogans serovar Hardjo str. Norma]|uniref:Uncharacterized protein n=1 Tax=Leptospira interrogans serovar Hardjo str. Norma TaxID=1279460 RepID=A0A0M3TN40_LEPIR|nr:hypothetical protein G436_4806 [Leptospira interrogans serovar Hardjo str. Norma]